MFVQMAWFTNQSRMHLIAQAMDIDMDGMVSYPEPLSETAVAKRFFLEMFEFFNGFIMIYYDLI